MNHIRFLSNNQTVCDRPKLLGYDFVVIDTTDTPEEFCKPCGLLLEKHNEKIESYSLRHHLPFDHGENVAVSLLAPARGLLIVIAASSLVWALIGFLIWVVWLR